MTLTFQAVRDPATDQNFRRIAQQFPITGQNLAGVLRLLFVGKGVVNVGKAEITFGGGSPEGTQGITHELGGEPLFAHVSPEDAGYVAGTKAYSSTTFTAALQKRDGTSPAAGTKAKFHWIAIG